MLKIRILPVLLFIFAVSVFAAEFPLENMIGSKCEVFGKTPADFVGENKRFFAWTSEKQESARYPLASRRRAPKLEFLGFPLCEAIASYKDNQLVKFYISIYNRGDSGAMDPAVFDQLVSDFRAALTKFTGVSGEPLKGRLASGMNVNAEIHIRDGFAYIAKWSVSEHSKKDRRPEYLQLEIEKFNPKDDPRKRSLTTVDRSKIETKLDLQKNVRKEDNGTVRIDGIPMVDQGRKGYCAAAVAERVLKYYGCEGVTQHTVAQLTGTDAWRGTSFIAMVEALRKAGSKFGIRLKERYVSDVDTIAELEKIVQRYNMYARRMKAKKINIVANNNTVFVGRTFAQMEPSVYREYKLKSEQRAFKDFQRDIHERIDKGLPLVWCVVLGMVPEKQAPQARGGHMRLIIGYNDKTKELIYSDTWGAGHELKTMPLEDAWVITTRTLFINPRPQK